MAKENKVGLREHFEALWLERDRRLTERWTAQEQALTKATDQLERRLDLLNELRGEVLTRQEYDAKHDALLTELARIRSMVDAVRSNSMSYEDHRQYEDRMRALESWKANVMGRAVAIGLVGGIFIAVVAAVLTHLAV